MTTEQAIRNQIKEALSRVTEANSPQIYHFLFDKKGQLIRQMYNRMENRIIGKMLEMNLTVAEAIPQVEMEMDER